MKDCFMLGVCMSSCGCMQKFWRAERDIRVAQGIAKSNSSFLSAL